MPLHSARLLHVGHFGRLSRLEIGLPRLEDILILPRSDGVACIAQRDAEPCCLLRLVEPARLPLRVNARCATTGEYFDLKLVLSALIRPNLLVLASYHQV